MMSQYFLMNYSLSALSARMYPIVDFEVVGTLIYNGLSGFALKRLWSLLSSIKKKKKKKKQKKDRLVE